MSKENYKQQKYREIHNEMEEEDQKKCFVMSVIYKPNFCISPH